MRGSSFESMPVETAAERNSRRMVSYPHIVGMLSVLLVVCIALVIHLDTGKDRQPALRPSQITKHSNTLLQVSEERSGLSIAWLMSFPNSGTSFTSKLVRHVTLGSTGSNYGHEVLSTDKVISMFGDDHPPFWIDPHSLDTWTRPSSLVLTKTHCGGRCEMCGPSDYVENPHSFLTQCLSGRVGDETASQYDIKLVKKAVHLIRNPFDNVVSRFHLERKLFSDRGNNKFTSDRTGFLAFCLRLSDNYGAEERDARWLDPHVYDMIKDVPCFSDFVRYVQWHNLAFVATQDKAIPTLVLHYEKFESNFDETVDGLIEFLESPRRGKNIEFILGKEYLDYFSEVEKDAIREGIKRMALSPTWDNVKHYFD